MVIIVVWNNVREKMVMPSASSFSLIVQLALERTLMHVSPWCCIVSYGPFSNTTCHDPL